AHVLGDRVAVDEDEERGPRREEDLRRVVPERRGGERRSLGADERERGLEAVEVHRLHGARLEVPLQDGEPRRLLVGGRREARARDLGRRERHEALLLVDARRRREPDDAVTRLLELVVGRDADRGAGGEVDLVPGLELGLVDGVSLPRVFEGPRPARRRRIIGERRRGGEERGGERDGERRLPHGSTSLFTFTRRSRRGRIV